MMDHRAAALATADFPVFSMPPIRPSRSGRRTDGPTRLSRMFRAMGRVLTRAANERETGSLPRLSSYPY